MTTTTAPPAFELLDNPGQVAAILSPLRRQILESLDEPDSATGLARRLGLPRQKVNYHLRELERQGLVELDEERQRRGCTERMVRPTARAWVVDPALLGELPSDPEEMQDRFSSAHLLSTASRLVRDAAMLRRRAREVERRLFTLTLESEVHFASPAERSAFAEELAGTLAELVARYDRPNARGARPFRFVLGGHSTVTKSESRARAEAATHARARKKKKKNTKKKRTPGKRREES